MSGFIQYDRIDVRRIKREYPFYSHTIRDLTNCKAGSVSVTLLLDNISLEGLDTLLVSFYDLIVHSDIITRFEGGKLFFTGKLFVYVCYGVHDPKFSPKTSFGGRKGRGFGGIG